MTFHFWFQTYCFAFINKCFISFQLLAPNGQPLKIGLSCHYFNFNAIKPFVWYYQIYPHIKTFVCVRVIWTISPVSVLYPNTFIFIYCSIVHRISSQFLIKTGYCIVITQISFHNQTIPNAYAIKILSLYYIQTFPG